VPENILCLCPNCHVLLDELAVWINDDHSLGGLNRLLRLLPEHAISSEHLQYHRHNVWPLKRRDRPRHLWLRVESIEDSANLPDPDVLALEIAEELEAALEQFAAIAEDLKRQ
jgi:hypothetical protein